MWWWTDDRLHLEVEVQLEGAELKHSLTCFSLNKLYRKIHLWLFMWTMLWYGMFKLNIIALWNENDRSLRDVSGISFPWQVPNDYYWTSSLTWVFRWWHPTGTEIASSAGLHHARLDIFCFWAKLTLWPCHAVLPSHWQTGLVGSLCQVKAT